MQRRVAIVTGGSSGLGKAVIEQLLLTQSFTNIVNWSLDTLCDVRDEDSIKRKTHEVLSQYDGKVDALIQCAGVNHIEAIPKLTIDDWGRIMDTNCRGLWLTVKHLCEALRGGTVCNIVSNAAKIAMTSSIAYNSSKAAALMLSKQMARELGKTHGITVFSVSPNKLTNTGMSDYINAEVCRQRGWTPEEALAYQLASLPAGVETDTNTLAEFIAFLLSTKQRHLHLQGCDLTYGGPV